ncbi:hypothetical protein [Caenimonas sp. SL110]|uniref:hypothetical protein n=1 Tax=Caenimonas sp. SL110 TaxID=1450524 RepID=UPI0006543232|nr:hypothetical protein [Caenimonas sp. SL110]
MAQPVLDPSATPIFPSVASSATNPQGVTVAALVVNGSITDADGTVEAIMVTDSVSVGLGTWQFSTDAGANWQNMYASGGFGYVLDASARIRFLPSGDDTGEAFIRFRAWDMSDGQVSGMFQQSGVSNHILLPQFSAATDTASIVVTGANSAPYFSVPQEPGTIVNRSGMNFAANKVVVLPDGKFVVQGNFRVDADEINGGDIRLARYNADGSLDETFGTGGFRTTALSPLWESCRAIALQDDGKLLVTGIISSGATEDIFVARLNANGSLDTSFGDGGTTQVAFSTRLDRAASLIIQSDGKIVVAGQTRLTSGDSGDFAIVRLHANGSLDTSFSLDGKASVSFTPSGSDAAVSLAQQADGKIVAVGATGSSSDVAVARFNVDGSLDASFGSGGLFTYPNAGGDRAQSVIVTPDQKILVAGYLSTPATPQGWEIGLVRLNSNGSLDTSFSGDGVVTTRLAAGGGAYTVKMQQDGKIVVGGYAATPDNFVLWDFVLVRYLDNGSLDPSFGTGGVVITDFARDQLDEFSDDTIYDFEILPDGRILAVGQSRGGFYLDLGMARYMPDGSLDPTFSADNHTYTLGGQAIVLDSQVQVFDSQLGTKDAMTGNYAGTTLTLMREGGAIASDHFAAKAGGSLSALTQGNNLVVQSVQVGTVVTNGGGQLTLQFNSNTTQALLDAVMHQIAYSSTVLVSQADKHIVWTFSDGNTGLQGTGGALADQMVSTVSFLAIIDGTDGPDTLQGGDGQDSISGFAGNDTLTGGLGNDTLDGGIGDDIAVFSNDFRAYTVSELAGGLVVKGIDGIDVVRDVELLRFADQDYAVQIGTAEPEQLAGGSLSDLMRGLEGADTLNGGQGDDALYGDEDADSLVGGGGIDLLDGGTGADHMSGGTGDDTYIVDSEDDVVIETEGPDARPMPGVEPQVGIGSGIDTIIASVSYAITDGVENLILSGALDIDAIGNALDNAVAGNSGSNAITGAGGNDSIDGGAGTDTAIYADTLSAYAIAAQGEAHTVTSGAEGADELTAVERLQFADARVALDMDGHAGLTARLVGTLFGPSAISDAQLVGHYLALFDAGMTYQEVADAMLASPRYAQAAGSHGNADYVSHMFFNVAGFHDAGFEAFLLDVLASGALTQAGISVLAADTDALESRIGFASLSVSGIAFEQQAASVAAGDGFGNFLLGTSGADHLTGRAGNDTLTGDAGHDTIDGGSGLDVAIFASARSQAILTRDDQGLQVMVGAETDRLVAVERTQFTDLAVAWDIEGNAGTVAKLIGALFGVPALQDEALVATYLGMLDNGMTYEQVAGAAAASTRFGSEAGSHTNEAFVDRVYYNIANFFPSPEVRAELVGYIEAGQTQAWFAVQAAEVSYNLANVNLPALELTGLEYSVV